MVKVITYGTFDLFHQGHVNLLERARKLGDYLIVGVTTEHFDEARGKINVVDSCLERVENVRKTGLADEIIIEDHAGQKIEDIQKYQIDIFTVGSDWIGTFDYLNALCKVVYLERTPNISSTMLRSSHFQRVKMGIIGTGRIAARFMAEEKYVSGMNIICAFNPETESGKRFQDSYGVQVESEHYSEFLNKVDAVYIASPNETHYEYAREAVAAGKHVLCENPIALNRQDAEGLFKQAGEREVVLLEGIKTAYCPGFQQLINTARSGQIGEIRDIEACFTRLADPYSRECTDALYGGAFMEYAAYTLLPIFKLYGTHYKDVHIRSIQRADGLDLYTKIDLLYEQGLATAKCGVGVKTEGQLVISGTKGYLLAESPWWLTRKYKLCYEDPNKVETFEPKFQGDGLRYEMSEFVAQINKVDKNKYLLTQDEIAAISEVTELFIEERMRWKHKDGIEEPKRARQKKE
ncbi:MAG: Gfo/Idh/MocA family oxidoreductase [Lachnospiraceae bacterium]|nr:Gfo/Idh/MocA family oxidoreductase [Lachnospiraceae bacterium]